MKIIHKATIQDGGIVPSDLERFRGGLSQLEGKEVSITIEKWQKTRSIRQNNSLWLWFSLLAQDLNLKGYDMRKIIRPSVDIEWTKDSLCDYLFKPLMNTMFNKKSTTKLTNEEINILYDNLNRIIIERTKGEVSVPFPNLDEMFRDK